MFGKAKYLLGLFALALVLVSVTTAATGDQGRRLAGPFCVGKPGLAPIGIKNEAGNFITQSRAGVVRSVSATEKCQGDEIRKLGLAVPYPKLGSGPVGPAGKDGLNGARGAAGATGATGVAGATGSAGVTGPTGEAGATGADGQDGHDGVPGADGTPGHKGDTGEQGPVGPAGADGEDGSDGLGDGTLEICLAGNGGINQAPCHGNQRSVRVVIVSAA